MPVEGGKTKQSREKISGLFEAQVNIKNAVGE
jgi:hypothetical protein